MKPLFIEYPKCGTCRKAAKWLKDNGIEVDDRHIVDNNPKAEELAQWIKASGIPSYRRTEPHCGRARKMDRRQRVSGPEILQHQRKEIQGAKPEGRCKDSRRADAYQPARLRRHARQTSYPCRRRQSDCRIQGRPMAGIFQTLIRLMTDLG